jgi:hypothetical protein
MDIRRRLILLQIHNVDAHMHNNEEEEEDATDRGDILAIIVPTQLYAQCSLCLSLSLSFSLSLHNNQSFVCENLHIQVRRKAGFTVLWIHFLSL